MQIPNNNIILVGFMASGKTTVGTHLASVTNRTFIDTDQLLEQHLGASIAEFFNTQGEALFRKQEQTIIRDTCKQSDQVICSGGGAFINKENQSIMLASGSVFWLDVTRDTVLERIDETQNDRPLLSHTNPSNKIDELLRERRQHYEKAHFRIDANSKTIEQLTTQILEYLSSN
tara:strand:- start:3623 stop:4144 length:522 start_codon:yes stop_codon:yes gene_type:complete